MSVRRIKKLYEVVIDEIKVLMESENLMPGDKLPTEKELIEILDVSRSSLREALTALQNEGYLEIIQGKGIFVKERKASLLQELDIEKNVKALDYIQEARLVVEGELAYLAAQRATEQDKKCIDSALKEMGEKSNSVNVKKRVPADYSFHYAIAEASKNPVLHDILRQIDDKLHSGRSVTLTFPKGREKAINAHQRIYQAICDNDPEKAKLEMRNHIKEVASSQKYIMALSDKKNIKNDGHIKGGEINNDI